MGRTHILPIRQPDDTTCGPAALKLALAVIGIRKSLASLIELSKTNRNGTSTKHMVEAVNKLGLPALVVEYATLHHLQGALKYPPNEPRAVLVSYLYDLDKKDRPHPESGHWAVVSSYSARNSRIVLLDSASGKKKSYPWKEFRNRWMDYDLKRRKIQRGRKEFKLIRHWQEQLLMIIAKDEEYLPEFKISTAKLFLASANPYV
ncbi:C39 family peptidase [Candidatus Gottesmanbacteria bacterium]|nr:C39 family peptidase [Candidatus Gottesmanbacteria bacterium]